MNDEFVIILLNIKKKHVGNFNFMKIYLNEDILDEYTSSPNSFSNIFHQMYIDLPRMNVLIGNKRITNVCELFTYISNNPYLKADQQLVYLFTSQTMLSLPLANIQKIIHNDLVISEHSDDTKRNTNITIEPDMIFINKKLRAVNMKGGDILTVMTFEIFMEVDLVVGETFVYIKAHMV